MTLADRHMQCNMLQDQTPSAPMKSLEGWRFYIFCKLQYIMQLSSLLRHINFVTDTRPSESVGPTPSVGATELLAMAGLLLPWAGGGKVKPAFSILVPLALLCILRQRNLCGAVFVLEVASSESTSVDPKRRLKNGHWDQETLYGTERKDRLHRRCLGAGMHWALHRPNRRPLLYQMTARSLVTGCDGVVLTTRRWGWVEDSFLRAASDLSETSERAFTESSHIGAQVFAERQHPTSSWCSVDGFSVFGPESWLRGC